MLLMAQRLDRIEQGRAPGWIEPEHDSDGDAEADRQKHGLRAENEGPLREHGDCGRRGYAERFNATIPLTTCATPVVYLAGLALAIFGLRDKARHRLFPILGIVLNGLAIPAQIALNAFWILLNV